MMTSKISSLFTQKYVRAIRVKQLEPKPKVNPCAVRVNPFRAEIFCINHGDNFFFF